MKLQYVRIDGENFPLCYSLRVMEAIEDRYGHIEDLGAALTVSEGKHVMDVVQECVWMLREMLAAGYDYAARNGMETPDDLPDGDAIACNFGIAELQAAIFGTIRGDSERSVGAAGPKNAPATPEGADG